MSAVGYLGLLPVSDVEKQAEVLNLAGEQVAVDLHIDIIGALCGDDTLGSGRLLPVNGEVLKRDAAAVLYRKRHDVSVKQEFRAATVDNNVLHAGEREKRAADARYAGGHCILAPCGGTVMKTVNALFKAEYGIFRIFAEKFIQFFGVVILRIGENAKALQLDDFCIVHFTLLFIS